MLLLSREKDLVVPLLPKGALGVGMIMQNETVNFEKGHLQLEARTCWSSLKGKCKHQYKRRVDLGFPTGSNLAEALCFVDERPFHRQRE